MKRRKTELVILGFIDDLTVVKSVLVSFLLECHLKAE
jgi:hypothetical protein